MSVALVISITAHARGFSAGVVRVAMSDAQKRMKINHEEHEERSEKAFVLFVSSWLIFRMRNKKSK
jgi:hypothetical protein